MTTQATTPTLREQLAAALPAHTHHETTLFGWRSTWSTPTGIWSISSFQGTIKLAGPNTTTEIRRTAATPEQLLDLLHAIGALPDKPAQDDAQPGTFADLRVPPRELKTLRETLCRIQIHLRAAYHCQQVQALIDEIDRHRPIGPDGVHGDRHTPTCGCEGATPQGGE